MANIEETFVSNTVLLVIAGAALTFLIKYLISSKDKNTEEIGKDIKKMTELLNTNATKTELLLNDFKHYNTSLANLRTDVQELTKLAIEHARKIESLGSYRGQSERQIAELEKKINYLKTNHGKT